MNMWILWIVGICGNIGMWFERFEIIPESLTRDFLPSSWHAFWPTWVDLCTLAGSFGLFMTLFLLFCRYLPTVAMAEVKTMLPEAHAHAAGPHGRGRTADGLSARRTSRSGHVMRRGLRIGEMNHDNRD